MFRLDLKVRYESAWLVRPLTELIGIFSYVGCFWGFERVKALVLTGLA
jgi:hypothetical protein